MADYVTPVNQYLKTIDLQPYDRYLPNAFNDSLTMLEKVNKVIYQLNESNQLTNEMVKEWNEFAEWMNTEGIDKPISDKMDELVSNGTFTNIIKPEFNEFKEEIIQKTEEEIEKVNSKLASSVKKVNGVTPNIDGDVTIEVPNIDTSNLVTKTDIQQLSLNFKESYQTLSALQTAYPNGDNANHVVLADNMIYTYKNGWISTGIQANGTGIADNSVKEKHVDFLKANEQNRFNPETSIDGSRLGGDGKPVADTTWSYSDYIPVKNGEVIKIFTGSIGTVTGRVAGYQNDKTFSKILSSGTTSGNNINIDFDGLVRFAFKTSDKMTTQLVDSAIYNGSFSPYGYVIKESVEAKRIGLETVSSSSLQADFRYKGTVSAGADLNTFTKDGLYLITGVANNRPPKATDTSGYLFVRNFGFSIIQDYIQYSAGKQRMIYRRVNRINIPEYGEWFQITPDFDQGFFKFSNEKIVLMGDSITGGANYHLQLTKRIGINTINCGFGGTRMTQHTDADFDKFTFHRLVDAKITGNFAEQDDAAKRLTVTNLQTNLQNLKNTDFSQVEYLSIWFGTNDFSGNAHLGENNSEDKTTVKGALQYGIRRLLETYPNLKIMVITPMFRMVEGGNSDTTPNAYRNLFLKDYSNAIEEVAKLNHLPCLNMYDKSGINRYNHTHYFTDGLHPYLEKGRIHVGDKIATFISTNF